MEEFENEYLKQAETFLLKTNTRIIRTFSGITTLCPWDKGFKHPVYEIAIMNKRHSYTFNFYGSRHDAKEIIKNCRHSVTNYDILAYLTKYNPGDFYEFCCEYGCNSDSISDLKTYQYILDEWKNVEKLFTSDQLELLREIQ